MSYDKLRDTIQSNNLSWTEINRIYLTPENYATLQASASFDVSNTHRRNSPVIKETDDTEKIVYIGETGIEVTIEL